MRHYLCIAMSVSLLLAPTVAIAQTAPTPEAVVAQSAPADEYFGATGESVLGIRNRLDALDQKSDSDVLSTGTVNELDSLQDCMLDWQSKYPADPWIPTMMSRLISDYARSGQTSSPRALAALRVMLDTYPNAQQTRDAVATLGTQTAGGNAILQGAALDAVLPAVSAAPLPDVVIAQTSDGGGDLLGSVAWQNFGSSRSAAPVDPVQALQTIAQTTTVASDDTTVAGAVIDARTGAPVSGAIVFVAPDKDSLDVTATPFATTGNDGAFSVAHVPLGAAYSVGNVSIAHAEYVVVQPPRGSGYAAYHGMIDASGGDSAGVIRLNETP